MMKKTMGLMVATLFAITAIATSASASTASHDQTCGSDAAGFGTCLANESWTAGFRAFDLLLHEPLGSSMPLWLGATSILVNPHADAITDEVLRDRFMADGSGGTNINSNNYAEMSSCDPRTNATAGNQSRTIAYTATGYWTFPIDVVHVAGSMDYGFDGFWFTDFLWIDVFSANQFHFNTEFAANTFPCTVQVGNGTAAPGGMAGTPTTTNLTPASGSDKTTYTV